MPTFEYAYHPSPFANSIAELLAHQNDPAAQAARIKGNLSARAIETSGQATSDLIRGITHAGTSALDSILQAQQQAPVVAANKIKLEQLQQAQGAQNELSRALEGDQLPAGDAGPRRPSLTSADGGYDLPAIGAWLNSRGAGAQAPEILQHLQQTNVAVAEAKLKQTAAAEAQTIADGRMAFTMYQGMALGMSPEQAYTGAVVPAKQSALYTPEQLEQKRSQLLSLPPDQLNARLTQMMTAAEQVGPKTKVGAEETVFGVLGRPIAKGASKPLTAAEIALKAAGTDPATGEPNYAAASDRLHPAPKQTADDHYRSILAAQEMGQPLTPEQAAFKSAYETFEKNQAKNKADAAIGTHQADRLFDVAHPLPPSAILVGQATDAAMAGIPDWARDDSRPAGADANTINPKIRMSPNGLFQSAITWIQTGQAPAIGRGTDPGSRAKQAAIETKAAAIATAAGMDVPQLRAFYKANAASMGKQANQLDQVQSFIATADRNADLLAGVLDKIPDKGSPLLNKPLRALDQKALGNVDMSQFTTYIKSVQNEYGRIIRLNLTDHLTDTAAHEAEQLLDPNATVAQILASIQALKNEGNNRVISLGEQIKRTQERMKIPPPTSGSAAIPGGDPTTGAAGPTIGSTVTYQGKRYRVKDIKNGQAVLEATP